MQRGIYSTWTAGEQNEDRIEAVHAADPLLIVVPAPPNEAAVQAHQEQVLDKRRRLCKTFLSQVAKCVSENHYTTVMRQATSLQWIYTKIREDYDILQRGIHFLNILDIKYDPATMTPATYHEH